LVIYAEYLFIENFIAGLLILLLTGKICGLENSAVRVGIGSIVCGVSAFVIFVEMIPLMAILMKLLISFSIIMISYGKRDMTIKRIMRSIVVFYIVSFVMGGVTIAVMGLRGTQGISSNGFIYTKTPTYITVAAGMAVSYVIMERFIGFLKEKINSERLLREVRIRLGDEEFDLLGYTDTGNHLKDPVMGRPVSVISKSAADALFIMAGEEEMEKRYCTVPYISAGVRKGMMDGFRVDEMMVISDRGKVSYRSSIFAIYDGDFKERDGVRGFDVLLNRDIVERGVI